MSLMMKKRYESLDERKRTSESMKGLVFSEKHRKNLSIAMTGRNLSNETKLKLSFINKGKRLSDEHKKKIGLSLIGRSTGRKGIPVSLEFKQMMSDRMKGENHPNFGKHLSVETRRKISEGNKGKKVSDEVRAKLRLVCKGEKSYIYGKKLSEKTKNLIRIARMKQVMPFKDTKPELLIQSKLINEGIVFEKHKRLLGQPDIFIEPNICLFVDGCYWHNCVTCVGNKNYPEFIKFRPFVDNYVNYKLMMDGFIVIRL